MRKLMLLLLVVETSRAKTFEKCELASVLESKHGMPRDDVKNWVCIAQYESTFNTEAVNLYNWDGSYDYGLFQLNNKYWCKDSNNGKNVCNMPCTDLLDADLTDDLSCIKVIIKDTEKWKGEGKGLTAWVAYVNKCQNRDLNEYMAECWKDSPPSNIINIRDQSAREPANTENQEVVGVGAGGDSPIINNARVPIRPKAVPLCINGFCPPVGVVNPYRTIYQHIYYKK